MGSAISVITTSSTEGLKAQERPSCQNSGIPPMDHGMNEPSRHHVKQKNCPYKLNQFSNVQD